MIAAGCVGPGLDRLHRPQGHMKLQFIHKRCTVDTDDPFRMGESIPPTSVQLAAPLLSSNHALQVFVDRQGSFSAVYRWPFAHVELVMTECRRSSGCYCRPSCGGDWAPACHRPWHGVILDAV
ncbi:hypothetical protein L1887_51339 [Cichorium endivia]|nr:hypothetical protein L1887_51339 [Cichorium endivia]